ncbi:hypothetical protein Plhal304r1_c003g0009851 [Plasmopara halstedii]
MVVSSARYGCFNRCCPYYRGNDFRCVGIALAEQRFGLCSFYQRKAQRVVILGIYQIAASKCLCLKL